MFPEAASVVGEFVPGVLVPGVLVPGVLVPGALVPGVLVPGVFVPGVLVPSVLPVQAQRVIVIRHAVRIRHIIFFINISHTFHCFADSMASCTR